jgi:hypothetical protein
MTTVGEVQAHEAAVGRHDGLVDLEVGRAATEALDIDTPFLRVDVEGLEGTALAQQLDLINVLVATIVASAGVALRVLVGHGGTKSIENGTGSDVLRGDEDNGLALALDLILLLWVLVSAPWWAGGIPANSGRRTMMEATSGSESRRDFSSIYTGESVDWTISSNMTRRRKRLVSGW